jgi:hypothetical protein
LISISHRRALDEASFKSFFFSRAPQEGREPAEAILAGRLSPSFREAAGELLFFVQVVTGLKT